MRLTLFHKIFRTSILDMRIFHKMTSVPHNIVMDLNNVMTFNTNYLKSEDIVGLNSHLININDGQVMMSLVKWSHGF